MARKYKKHIPGIDKPVTKERKQRQRKEPTTTIRIPLRLKPQILELIHQNGGTQKLSN